MIGYFTFIDRFNLELKLLFLFKIRQNLRYIAKKQIENQPELLTIKQFNFSSKLLIAWKHVQKLKVLSYLSTTSPTPQIQNHKIASPCQKILRNSAPRQHKTYISLLTVSLMALRACSNVYTINMPKTQMKIWCLYHLKTNLAIWWQPAVSHSFSSEL